MSFYKIRPRSGTAAQWGSANTVLGEREIGFEVPNAGAGKGKVKMKMGDGITAWNDLPYAFDNTADEITGTFTPAALTNVSVISGAVKQFGKIVYVQLKLGLGTPPSGQSHTFDLGVITGVGMPAAETIDVCATRNEVLDDYTNAQVKISTGGSVTAQFFNISDAEVICINTFYFTN